MYGMYGGTCRTFWRWQGSFTPQSLKSDTMQLRRKWRTPLTCWWHRNVAKREERYKLALSFQSTQPNGPITPLCTHLYFPDSDSITPNSKPLAPHTHEEPNLPPLWRSRPVSRRHPPETGRYFIGQPSGSLSFPGAEVCTLRHRIFTMSIDSGTKNETSIISQNRVKLSHRG